MPHVSIRNFSNQNICYSVEYSNGTGAFPSSAICGGVKGNETGGFWLDSGKIKEVNAIGLDGQPFCGAITAMLDNNTLTGARNEMNFLNARQTYYDISYEYGISDGTCGPADGSNPAGELHTLSKANKAWRSLNQTTKDYLLTFPDYLKQGGNGSLDYINMNINAWPDLAPDVVYFFQATAGFQGYMGSGSVRDVEYPAGSLRNISVGLADKQCRSSPSNQFVITSY